MTPQYAPATCGTGFGSGFGGAFTGGGYNFTTLVALILIVLVFGNKGRYGKGGAGGWRDGVLDNGILFIIAFFFLACGCGKVGTGC